MSLVLQQAEYETLDFTDPVWIAAAICRFMKYEGELIFPELMSIPHFSRDLVFGIPKRNICLWPTVSKVAAEAISILPQDKQIHMSPCLPKTMDSPPEPV
jgi:hypothetical protein